MTSRDFSCLSSRIPASNAAGVRGRDAQCLPTEETGGLLHRAVFAERRTGGILYHCFDASMTAAAFVWWLPPLIEMRVPLSAQRPGLVGFSVGPLCALLSHDEDPLPARGGIAPNSPSGYLTARPIAN